jgi:thiamine pyrophosphate-dependent acetolactate synthase large subunit-like protein
MKSPRRKGISIHDVFSGRIFLRKTGVSFPENAPEDASVARIARRRNPAVAERERRELTEALVEAFEADEPRLIHVPVGPMPDPWRFVHLPKARG